MIIWNELYHDVSLFAKTELGRIVATVVIIAVTTAIVRFVQRRSRQGAETMADLARRRRSFVLAKNLVFIAAFVLIGTIWASKIAGAALSLAAVAGAMLIVSKEFLANMLGGAMLAISRPYRVGDFIEIEDVSGRVLDSDMLTTTLAETLEGHQLTGRSVSIPHSILLVRPVRNLTATGHFMVNIMHVAVHPNEDLFLQEEALLKAANEVCEPWIAEANLHLRRLESRELLDLPSAESRVIIELSSAKEYTFSLRYCCRPNERVKVEQAVTRLYLRYRSGFSVPPGPE
jgi:small-conductance mechanosensitive channel